MLRQRVATASVLALIAIWAVLKLPVAGFGLMLLLVVLLGAWEWSRLAALDQTRDRLSYGVMVLAAILAIWPFIDRAEFINSLLIAVCAGWCYVPIWLRRYADQPSYLDHPVTIRIVGLVMLVASWAALMGLRDRFGSGYVLFLLLLIWAADIGAYFIGRRWGRHKLAPTISPGKTWEGVWGAVGAALTFAIIGAAILGIKFSHGLEFVAICMVAVGFSIIGDLFESMFKRQCGMKDSGSLLPGHGGVLDRMDSLMAAAPVFLLGLHGMQR